MVGAGVLVTWVARWRSELLEHGFWGRVLCSLVRRWTGRHRRPSFVLRRAPLLTEEIDEVGVLVLLTRVGENVRRHRRTGEGNSAFYSEGISLDEKPVLVGSERSQRRGRRETVARTRLVSGLGAAREAKFAVNAFSVVGRLKHRRVRVRLLPFVRNHVGVTNCGELWWEKSSTTKEPRIGE